MFSLVGWFQIWEARPPAGCRRPQGRFSDRLVAQLLSGIDQVRVPQSVKLGDALPAGRTEDAAQRLTAPDDVDPRTRAASSVGDGLAGPDAVDVAGGHAPCGHGP